jgi:repressor of nif and glnA expression
MASSDTFDPVHVMDGMSYDHLGQLLSTSVDGVLLKEGVDFQMFNPADSGVITMEDGISVNRTWLSDVSNVVTLVKFLKVSCPVHHSRLVT